MSLNSPDQAQLLHVLGHLRNMTPSIAEIPTAEVVVPVKADTQATSTKPKVRRIIDEEGGNSTASVW